MAKADCWKQKSLGPKSILLGSKIGVILPLFSDSSHPVQPYAPGSRAPAKVVKPTTFSWLLRGAAFHEGSPRTIGMTYFLPSRPRRLCFLQTSLGWCTGLITHSRRSVQLIPLISFTNSVKTPWLNCHNLYIVTKGYHRTGSMQALDRDSVGRGCFKAGSWVYMRCLAVGEKGKAW